MANRSERMGQLNAAITRNEAKQPPKKAGRKRGAVTLHAGEGSDRHGERAEYVQITVRLPREQLHQLKMAAAERIGDGTASASVSAVIRDAVAATLGDKYRT